jgi:hypothetical protein
MSKDFIAGIINPCYKDEIELSFFNVKRKIQNSMEQHIPLSFDYEIEEADPDLQDLENQCVALIQNYSNKKGRMNPARKVK